MQSMPDIAPNPRALKIGRMGTDTHQEPVIYMATDCHICRSEGFEARSRVLVTSRGNIIIGTLNVVTGDRLISNDEAGLSDAAWRLLQAHEGDHAEYSHPEPPESLSHVCAKVFGQRLGDQ